MVQHSEARLVVEPQPANVPLVRTFLRATLRDWGRSHLEETAVLLTSELVTNVVLHARTCAELCIVGTPGRLRVEVRDDAGPLPAPRRHAADATTGRGLLLVEALAAEWGSEVTPHGKIVWFEIADTGADTLWTGTEPRDSARPASPRSDQARARGPGRERARQHPGTFAHGHGARRESVGAARRRGGGGRVRGPSVWRC